MGFNINNLRTDTEAESSGVWVNAGAGLELKIARLGNPEYTRYLSEKLRPHREQAIRGVGEIDPAIVESATIAALARHVLLDWKNLQEPKLGPDLKPVKDEKGNEILVDVPYSIKKAEDFLRIKDFADIVTSYANSMQTFKLQNQKENEGN